MFSIAAHNAQTTSMFEHCNLQRCEDKPKDHDNRAKPNMCCDSSDHRDITAERSHAQQ